MIRPLIALLSVCLSLSLSSCVSLSLFACTHTTHTTHTHTQGLRTLPLNLLDALREFKKDDVLAEGMGREVADAYYNLRMNQWIEYGRHMSSWEIENTLDA